MLKTRAQAMSEVFTASRRTASLANANEIDSFIPERILSLGRCRRARPSPRRRRLFQKFVEGAAERLEGKVHVMNARRHRDGAEQHIGLEDVGITAT
jgi:hypothetical protein